MELKQFRDTDLLVSSTGEVMNALTGYVQEPKYNKGGYARVCVGHREMYLLSRVVAECFLPNPDNLPQVDHIDRNTKNNDVSNLRWVSEADNLKNRGDYKNSPYGIKYIQTNKDGRFRVRKPGLHVKCFKTLDEAKQYLTEQTVS
jgi:hypothetical protein